MNSSQTVSSESCTSKLPTYTVASWFLSCACWPMRLAPTPAVMRPPATPAVAMPAAECQAQVLFLPRWRPYDLRAVASKIFYESNMHF